MTRYVALLRGVSPRNAKMPALRRCFEEAGFGNVRTLLSSGNVAFDARGAAGSALERRAEAAMQQHLGCSFYTIVRTTAQLQALLASDPFAGHVLPRGAKRVVSFLRAPARPLLALPLAADGASVLGCIGREVFTAYVPGDKGPVFMKLIESAFGTEVTTRTWNTVARCAAA
ncbi:MAG: DUF1697 domain-containing protein [Ideonella sp.]|nr:DUF1697 domain-containing protein [Ideonella sp.]MCC7458199.1 DUF1697 domain-containing protein [Nitrospira sp.]